jgi:AraC-like DNA-binding protein
MLRWTSIDFFIAGTLIGATLAIVIGMARLLKHPSTQSDRILGVLFILLSFPQLSIAFERLGLFFIYPRALFPHVPFYVFFGPLAYFYFHQIIEPGFRPVQKKHQLLHLVPFAIVQIALLPLYFLSDAELDRMAHGRCTFQWYLDLIFVGISVYTLIFLALVLRDFFSLLQNRNGQLPPEYKLTAVFVFLGAVFVSLLVWNQIQRSQMATTLGFLGLGFLPVLMFWGAQRFPQYLDRMKKEASRARYERSRLGGLDSDSLIRRLTELMEIEALYSDEDLDLARLAAILDLTPHKLSEILNDKIGLTFKNYINGYRVRAACELLVQEPDRAVLSIMGAVGFGSKSSFNAEFVKATGQSPSDYRKSLTRQA